LKIEKVMNLWWGVLEDTRSSFVGVVVGETRGNTL